MKSFAIASGSTGNCFYIETDSKKKYLVDIGVSYKRAREVLKSRGIDINDINGIFITHEHTDHIGYISAYVKNLKCKIYISQGTLDELDVSSDNFVIVKNHDMIKIDDVNIFVVSKSHDGMEPVSYVFENSGKKLQKYLHHQSLSYHDFLL
jgi:phosphoribosyl 1,2-cyclic phosphodiesterase